MHTCTCHKFLDNIDSFNLGHIYLQQVTGKGYTGDPLEFCPWCGKRLQLIKITKKKKPSFWKRFFSKKYYI